MLCYDPIDINKIKLKYNFILFERSNRLVFYNYMGQYLEISNPIYYYLHAILIRLEQYCLFYTNIRP